MRYQGRISSWNEPRGFGFIKTEQQDGEIFVHISSLTYDGKPPRVGERVTYLLGVGKENKPCAVQVFFPERPLSLAGGIASSSRPDPSRTTSTRSPQVSASSANARIRPAYSRKPGWAGKLIPLLVLVGGFFLYTRFSTDQINTAVPVTSFPAKLVSAPAALTSSYQCDGREHCSQMTTCEEATWFLRHCPNTKMDGEGDGIPCEDQLCGH